MADYSVRPRGRSRSPIAAALNVSPQAVQKMNRVELVKLARSINSHRKVIDGQGYISKNKLSSGRNTPKPREELLEEICRALGFTGSRKATSRQDISDESGKVGESSVRLNDRRQPLGIQQNTNNGSFQIEMPHLSANLQSSPLRPIFSVEPISISSPENQEVEALWKELQASRSHQHERAARCDEALRQVNDLRARLREKEVEKGVLLDQLENLKNSESSSNARNQWGMTMFEKIERDVECPICLEEVIAIPTVFREANCQHTACAKCMLTLLYPKFSTQNQNWEGDAKPIILNYLATRPPGSIECPKCQAGVAIPNENPIRRLTQSMNAMVTPAPSPLALNRSVDSIIDFAVDLLDSYGGDEWKKGTGEKRLDWERRAREGKYLLDQFNRAWNNPQYGLMGRTKAQFQAFR